jgi:hypothetical protein
MSKEYGQLIILPGWGGSVIVAALGMECLREGRLVSSGTDLLYGRSPFTLKHSYSGSLLGPTATNKKKNKHRGP